MASGSESIIGQQVSWVWWISNDEYSWPGNHFRDGRNVDIRSNSRSFGLSPKLSNQLFSPSGIPIAFWWSIANNPISASVDWYLDSDIYTQLYKNKSASSGSPDYANMVYYGNKLLILSNKYIHSFSYNSATAVWYGLWSADIVSAQSTWTWAAGWTLVGNDWTHASGWGTGTLVDNAGTVTTAKYIRMQVRHTGTTTWSCTVTIWGITIATLDNTNVTSTLYFRWTTASAAKLTFTPTNTFNWTIQNKTTIYETAMEEEKRTFNNSNSKKPYLIFKGNLLIGDWYKVVQLTWNGSTYVPTSGSLAAYTKITIDLTETILWIYELWDQVVFFTDKAQYFRDWFNAAYDRRVPWDDTIVATAQDKTMFYVVTKWLYTQIFKTSSWYDRVPIQKDEATDQSLSRLWINDSYTNAMINNFGIKYFWWGNDWVVNTYGSFNPGMPESFMKYVTGSWIITALYSDPISKQYILFWWRSGSTYRAGYFDISRQQTNYITTEEWLVWLTPEIWSSEWSNKVMEKQRLSYNFSNGNKSKITLYAKRDDETDRYSFKVGNPTVNPWVWATYTNNSSTFTVINVYEDVSGNVYIGTQRTSWTNMPSTNGTLTKTWWTGDASLTFSFNVWGRLIALVDGEDAAIKAARRYPLTYTETWNKVQYAICLETLDWTGDPRVFDFIWEYTESQNDL